MTKFYSIDSVTIGTAAPGSEISSVLREAQELGLDYIAFNGRLIPVTYATDLTDYQTVYPAYQRPDRLDPWRNF